MWRLQLCAFFVFFSNVFLLLSLTLICLHPLQLQGQLDSIKKALSQRGIDLEAAQQQLQYANDEKVSFFCDIFNLITNMKDGVHLVD